MKKFCLIVLIVSMATVASAGYKDEWTNATGDGLWSTAGNWASNTGVVPLTPPSASTPRIANGTSYVPGNPTVGGLCTLDYTVSIVSLDVGKFGYSGDLLINASGSLTLTGTAGLLLASQPVTVAGQGKPSLTVAGTLNLIQSPLSVGHANPAIFTQLGGSTTTAYSIFGAWGAYPGGTEVHLLGGLYSALNGEINAATTTIYVGPGGEMRIGNASGNLVMYSLETMFAAGRIIGVDGASPVAYIDYATDEVVLVPEPATMVLLGLGGLLLRRKK